MNPSENNFDSNNARPFMVHSMTQQPYPSFWYQNPAYDPVFFPAAGPRNGNLYFPGSVMSNEYLGFLVPQSPLPTTLNRRPVFPMCYNPAQFWSYNGYAKQMKTQETQTEFQQVQHNGISQSSCESWGVPSTPQEGEDLITYKGEQRAVQSEHYHDVRHDELLKPGLTMEMDQEKKGYVAVPQILPPPDEVKDRDETHNTLNSDLYPSTGDVNTLHEGPLCTSMEAVKDLSLQPRSEKPLGVGEVKPDNSRGSHGFPEKVDEEEMGEQNSYPEGAVPSAPCLAQFEKVDKSTQCDMSWWQEAELERCPEQVPLVNEEWSPDCTTQGAREKSRRNRKLKSGDQVKRVFLNRKTVYLKRNALLHVVVPDYSDDSDLEEDYEVEWLFEEEDSSGSSKEKFYREACRASWLPHGYPHLVWPSKYMDNDGKYAEYENIPLMCVLTREDDHEIVISKLRMKFWAKQEESQESLECK